ncbi:hypothetical protein GDI0849 [Gluconacetobacter diazotrophicus PA1 5]|uniref:Uncharacterized protein n=1 Tax=Gluconacetobacter diazotrophicus (strain ATCC 49037 / DSM 5601 / CCUG 37298 / CIP 103539 / LMG 7603 / PAl5) TaxID=272568 RepID=A9HBB3_GLUDA|nr:hypothetical protein GDI0849 [Gluconacetobacter diazotrophicus PA1 5]
MEGKSSRILFFLYYITILTKSSQAAAHPSPMSRGRPPHR